MNNDAKYIRRCIELSKVSLKKGELPFGSLIVKDNKIIAQSGNRTRIDNDITHHAEIVVLRAAQKILNTSDLSACAIYASTEPCPMCSFVIRELQLKKVVFAVISPIMGGYTRFKILQDRKLETLSHFYTKPPEIIGGLLEKEAGKVWKEWRMLRDQEILRNL